jgi:Holliday junction resolvase RusA-like endonuclease
MLCALLFSYFFKNERKPSKTLDIYLLKLNSSNDNYKATTESSIKSSKLNEILDYSLSFKLIMIVAFKKSKSNQCPWDWFNTQALTIGNTTSIMI